MSPFFFVVTNLKDITDKVIAFLDKSSIKGVKASDYADFVPFFFDLIN